MFTEKAFLGCLIKADYLIKDTLIRPEQLEDTRHQMLFRHMNEWSQVGKRIDLISLTTMPNLDYVGGMSYLSELLSYADIEKFSEVEELIIDAWKEREKRNLLTLAAMNDWQIEEVITKLNQLNERKINDHTSITEELVDMFELPWQEKVFQQGVTTGLSRLDEVTNGFQDGEITIIAARPSMGKTDVMLHMAKHAGWAGYLPIVFSLEMPRRALTNRLLASTGQFNRRKMKNPHLLLTDEQKSNWTSVVGALNETGIQIFDGAGQTVSEMRAKTRKMMNDFPERKPVIFIDYLTLIKAAEFYGGNTHQQVSEISKNLKAMAKEFNCPVICLAQLNRSVESRSEKRPLMSDIRESGSIEQDADVIIFLYREKYYNRDSMDDSLELIISKNRNGPVGIVRVQYNPNTGVLKNAN